MRHHHLLAILLASSMFSPALAQEVEATLNADSQVAAVVERAAVQEAREDRMERADRSWPAGADRPRGMPDRAERREAPPQILSQTVPQTQAEPEPRRDWSSRRGGDNRMSDNNPDRGNQRADAPIVMAAPPARGDENRGWRGDRQRRGDDAERRGGDIINTPTPPVARQETGDGNRNWRGNQGNWQGNGRNWPGNGQGPVRSGEPNWRGGDRDRDGTPNWRDRDRDGDGIRNNRDWDRNNNGRVDRRWDRNNNGVVDRRYDWNRNGVRDDRWNNNQRWGNNQNWNQGWRNDRRYDWERYRYQNRNLYRQPRYASPFGYGYRYQRFGIGIYLESIFFGSRYRISDPWRYRLPDASWPYQWVRYYDDVLLVDTRNGYVVDVIHDFFW